MHLAGKKILICVTPFHDYHKLIKEELELQGSVVFVVENRWPQESFRYSTNWLLTLKKWLVNPRYMAKHTDEVITQIGDKTFDHLLALGGFSPNRKLIKHLKKSNPQIKTTIFFWDSFKYWKIEHLRKWFDKAYSFDPVDCKKYKDLIYQPDFYIGCETAGSAQTKYDITHIGSSHIFAYDRIVILDKLKQDIENKGLKSYIMIYDSCKVANRGFKLMCLSSLNWAKYKRVLKQYSNNGIITNQKVPYYAVQEIEAQSTCIVDIPPRNQTGMTIRALETIARGKKLLTTNQYIKNEPFYRPENIAILDRKNPTIDVAFLTIPIVEVNIEHLRLDNWLKTILS